MIFQFFTLLLFILAALRLFISIPKQTSAPYYALLLLLNPYCLSLIDQRPQQTFSCISLLLYFGTSHPLLSLLLLCAAAAFDPINALFLVLLKPLHALGSFAFLFILWNLPQLQTWKLVFPDTFTPQLSLGWLLYSHLFNDYLRIYQCAILFLLFGSTLLLRFILLPPTAKLATVGLLSAFGSNSCSPLRFLTMLAGFYDFPFTVAVEPKQTALLMEVMTTVWAIGNAVLLLLVCVLQAKRDWMVNMGYLFVFQCILWGLNIVFVTESLPLIRTTALSSSLHSPSIRNLPFQTEQQDFKNCLKEEGKIQLI